MKLCEKIKHARNNAGVTQVEAAKAMKVARQTFIDLETGKTQPRLDAIELMCSLFSVPFCYWSSNESLLAGGIGVFTDLQLINELKSRAEKRARVKESDK